MYFVVHPTWLYLYRKKIQGSCDISRAVGHFQFTKKIPFFLLLKVSSSYFCSPVCWISVESLPLAIPCSLTGSHHWTVSGPEGQQLLIVWLWIKFNLYRPYLDYDGLPERITTIRVLQILLLCIQYQTM